MKALIDLDPLVYNYADLRFPDGNSMPAYIAERYLMDKIEDIVHSAGADTWRGYLTFGPDNFRIELATIRAYKGNRVREKPPLHDHLRSFLCTHPNVQMVFGMEADDALAIEQYKGVGVDLSRGKSVARDNTTGEEEWLVNKPSTIICTLDKDLDMVPGWHYRWGRGNVKEIKPWFQDDVGGMRCFYKQCLTGDSVDNIPGLRGIGPKSAHLNILDGLEQEIHMFDHVRKLYESWYGNYGDQFLLEVGQLLWMKRTPTDMWRFPDETTV